MFTAPNNINNSVHSKLELGNLKISGIQVRRSLPFKLNFFTPVKLYSFQRRVRAFFNGGYAPHSTAGTHFTGGYEPLSMMSTHFIGG